MKNYMSEDDATQPQAPLPIPAVPAAMPNLTQIQLVKLAREVALDIHPIEKILVEYNITEAEFETVQKNPYYKRVFDKMVEEWQSPLSTPERIRLISAAFLEEALPVLGARMQLGHEDLKKVVETGALLGRFAGVGERKEDKGSGEKFTITINLGADEKLRFEKDITPSPQETIQVEEQSEDKRLCEMVQKDQS